MCLSLWVFDASLERKIALLRVLVLFFFLFPLCLKEKSPPIWPEIGTDAGADPSEDSIQEEGLVAYASDLHIGLDQVEMIILGWILNQQVCFQSPGTTEREEERRQCSLWR